MGRYLGLLGHLPGVYCLEPDTRLFPDRGDQDQAMEDVLLLLVPASNPERGDDHVVDCLTRREALVFNI